MGYSWAEDKHELITYDRLSNWSECPNWKDWSISNYGKYDFSKNPCDYFNYGKQKASTLSLTVLVMIEMLNALNAISDE